MKSKREEEEEGDKKLQTQKYNKERQRDFTATLYAPQCPQNS